jgi:TolB-like protein/Tfp pilus assembly protein PilF
MTFFTELKRRNVVRMAGLYLVGSWLLVQVAGTVLPMFGAPEWLPRSIVVLLAVGFVPALIFSWVFELTPQGLKRDEDVAPEQSIAPQTARKMDRMIIAVLAIALSYFGFDKFVLAPRREAALVAATSQSHATLEPNTAPTAANAKSIAVLPFDNLSHEQDNAYFAEGVQDEILTRLAKVADLKVISRTSTQKYKSAPDNLRAIAQQLGVANVLEGSVQKSQDQVRVNVQLINALTDAHLWADTYDRKLTDIFAVESDIAKAIADTLQAKLSSSAEHVLASRPTDNPEAHELYLKGRYFWNRRTGPNLQKAVGYFEQAIEKDPKYALAYSGLADCHVLLPVYPELGSYPRDEMPKALAAAHKAVDLDDSLAEAHTSLARALASDLQLSAAMSEFKRAIELNPSYATAHQWFGECLQSQGRVEEGLAELKRAQEVDPLSLVNNALVGFALDTVGKKNEAIAQLRRTIEMDPNFANTHGLLGNVLENQGQLKEAVVEYEKSHSLGADPIAAAQLARAYFLVGRKAEAQQFWDKLKALSERQYVPAYSLALVQLAFGDKDEALRLLEKSYEDHAPFDSADLGWILIDHRLDDLRSDPRFKQLITVIFSGGLR